MQVVGPVETHDVGVDLPAKSEVQETGAGLEDEGEGESIGPEPVSRQRRIHVEGASEHAAVGKSTEQCVEEEA